MPSEQSRRRVLSTAGASLFVGLAGCTSITGNGGDEQTTASATGDETPTTTAATETGTPATETQTSQRRQVETKVLDDFEDLSQWKLKNGKLSTSGNAYAGSQSMQLTRQGGEPLVTRPVDLNLEKTNLSMAVRTDANTPVVFDILVDAPDARNRLVLTEGVRVPPGHSWLRIDPGVANVKGLPDLTKVKRLSIHVRGGNSGAKIWIDDLRTTPSPEKPVIAITFDDSLTSHYTEAFQYMQKKKMPGSASTITGSVGEKGHLNLNQMKEMKKAGWEFASHSHSDSALLGNSRIDMQRDVVQAKQWLVDNGFKTGAQYFVYPYGQYNESIKNFISKYHNMAFRYIGSGSIGSGMITEAMTASRGNAANIPQAKKMVDISTLYNDLEIFTFHNIADDPDDNLAVAPKKFKSFIDYVDNTKADVITLSEVEKRFLVDISQQ